jgi:hypothetical protein
MAKGSELKQAVKDEFAYQQKPVPTDEEVAALARVAAGAINADAGSFPFPADKVQQQVIAHVVVAFTHPPDPRDVHGDQIGDLVKATFDREGKRKPTAPVLEALRRIAVGFLSENENPQLMVARVVAAKTVVDFYLDGV